ncbi:hypothetical protein NLI96_g5731 [Meripilus lineatus]|uniref:MOSC domain-containing protein n=1 Tax=Meripilus lineatus TaxID=2056292 RepID=A0AAD5V2J1_9APHY|nr:hypothetical protein NLI96_g5731 [Physisporinus lineatus]
MKGPVPRPCPPTTDFPKLEANSVFQDVYPLLVASEESLQEVAKAVREAAEVGEGEPGRIGGINSERWKDGELEIERFRPNIVIKGTGVAFSEEAMRDIIISPKFVDDSEDNSEFTVITLVSKCTRCLLPNVDIKTGIRDAAVPYKVLTKLHKDIGHTNKPLFGCNGVPSRNGVVRVGDYVSVKAWVGSEKA